MGKSNFLEALSLIKANSVGGIQKRIRAFGSPDSLFFNGPEETKKIELLIKLDRIAYTFTLGITHEDPPQVHLKNEECYFKEIDGLFEPSQVERRSVRSHRAGELLNAKKVPGYFGPKRSLPPQTKELISGWKIYHFHNTESNSVLRKEWEVKDCFTLHSKGENLAPFLLYLNEGHSATYKRFRDIVRSVIPFFDDFLFKPTEYGNGAKQVGLSWKHRDTEFIMQPYQLSDGSLRFIALVACLLQPHPPSTIIIDEPELGLHPYAIELFADIIKSGINSQIIMATQSPHLVSSFAPEHVIAVNNSVDGSEFKRMNKEELAPWLEDYTLGELWYKNVIEASP